MGLTIHPNVFGNVPYGIFHDWRVAIANALDLPPLKEMEGFSEHRGAVTKKWDSLPYNPLFLLLNHSDCDGELRWEDGEAITGELEKNLPKLPQEWHEMTEKFINGYRRAAEKKKNLIFG